MRRSGNHLSVNKASGSELIARERGCLAAYATASTYSRCRRKSVFGETYTEGAIYCFQYRNEACDYIFLATRVYPLSCGRT